MMVQQHHIAGPLTKISFGLPYTVFSRPYLPHPILVSLPPGTETFHFPGLLLLSEC